MAQWGMTRDVALRAGSGLALALLLFGCGGVTSMDGGADAGVTTDGAIDAGAIDGGATDAGAIDGGATDAGVTDATTPTGSTRALFIGNSYTFVNDLPGLFGAIARSLPAAPSAVFVDSSTGGGRRLVQHVSDARTVGHPLHTALNTDVSWTHVILQEQSQIPGFPAGQPEFEESKLAAAELGGLATMRGATVVLFMTWGRRDGDSTNMGLFPDFTAMQDRLEAGYRALADEARAAGATVLIAPVGLAFREVHQSEADPLAPGALFGSLYADDGSHPSLAGSYLAGCVFTASILEVDATTITHVPAGLDPAVAAQLRAAAQAAVAAERARP